MVKKTQLFNYRFRLNTYDTIVVSISVDSKGNPAEVSCSIVRNVQVDNITKPMAKLDPFSRVMWQIRDLVTDSKERYRTQTLWSKWSRKTVTVKCDYLFEVMRAEQCNIDISTGYIKKINSVVGVQCYEVLDFDLNAKTITEPELAAYIDDLRHLVVRDDAAENGIYDYWCNVDHMCSLTTQIVISGEWNRFPYNPM
jgi:hypothetical protein